MPVMGTNPGLDGLEIRGLPYLVGVASTTRFRLAQDVEEDSGEQPAPPYQGQGRPRRARRLEDRIPSREANALLEELLQDAWQAITWREGTKGNLTKEFTRVRVYRVGRRGKPLPTAGWLIGQRPLPGQQGESKYCFAWGLDSLSLQDQVVLAHNRWVIESSTRMPKENWGWTTMRAGSGPDCTGMWLWS